MFKRIATIKKFGVYSDFNWPEPPKGKLEFKKLNIIYGRNYSGKTTLSRIARCIEKQILHPNYLEGSFEIITDSSAKVNNTNLTEKQYEVRVFNKDFINENLKILIDENGEIKPFAILGEKNIEIETKIKSIEALLGTETLKDSLIYNHKTAKTDCETSVKDHETKEKDLEKKLQDKAREFKEDRLLSNVNYKINNIKDDIREIKTKGFAKITAEDLDAKRLALQEAPKPSIAIHQKISLEFSDRELSAKAVIEKKVTPVKALEDLVKDSELQEWVRLGIAHHKSKRESCAFCDSKIQESVWERLDSHFNKQSEELRALISIEIDLINKHLIALDKVEIPLKESFYTQFQSQFTEACKTYNNEFKSYKLNLSNLLLELEKKSKNIFDDQVLSPFIDNTAALRVAFENIQELNQSNNSKTSTLVSDQKLLVNEVRYELIRKFIDDISYDSLVLDISNLKKNVDNKKVIRDQLESQMRSSYQEITTLQSELKDEKKGASKVNEYLKHFFGHDSLRLEAEESQGSSLLFKIKRNEQDAKNLSEGEASLIAFCYFMAKLSDVDTLNKNPVVWIDDPISSLDNNHIFFMFSLIESVLARPIDTGAGNKYKYQQLFISTHNLDFLKYLKRLSHPKIKGAEKDENDFEYFILDREKDTSKLLAMPNHLKNYVTEFNYLFHQIYKCSTRLPDDGESGKFYSFGNNLRKFLEAYLYYRYPSPGDTSYKAKKFFGDEATAEILINRISNELSHLEGCLERGAAPLDIPEIQKVADFVLSKIETKDIDQFSELKKSVNV